MLKEAGWEDTDGDGFLDKDGKKFSFEVLVDDEPSQHIVEVMQIDLKDCGIEMKMNVMDEVLKNQTTDSDDYQASIQAYGCLDSSCTLPYIIYDSGIFDDDTYYDTVYAASAETDDAKRLAGYTKAQKMLMDTCSYMPIAYGEVMFAYGPRGNGLKIVDGGNYYFNDIQ